MAMPRQALFFQRKMKGAFEIKHLTTTVSGLLEEFTDSPDLEAIYKGNIPNDVTLEWVKESTVDDNGGENGNPELIKLLTVVCRSEHPPNDTRELAHFVMLDGK